MSEITASQRLRTFVQSLKSQQDAQESGDQPVMNPDAHSHANPVDASGSNSRMHHEATHTPTSSVQTAEVSRDPSPSAHVQQQKQQHPIKVIVVDDHKIVREGLVGVLNDEPDITVIAEATDGRAAIEALDELNPDVVVMDVTMPRTNGVEATYEILKRRPHVRIIGLSMHETDHMAQAMLRAGAIAYLTKGSPSSELINAIRQIT